MLKKLSCVLIGDGQSVEGGFLVARHTPTDGVDPGLAAREQGVDLGREARRDGGPCLHVASIGVEDRAFGNSVHGRSE